MKKESKKKDYSTKKKIIISLIITIIWYFFLFIFANMVRCYCPVIPDNCFDYELLSPIHGACHCGCTSIFGLIFEFLLVLSPFFMTYLILSNEKKRILIKVAYWIAAISLLIIIIAGIFSINYRISNKKEMENTDIEKLQKDCLAEINSSGWVKTIQDTKIFTDSDSFEDYIDNYNLHEEVKGTYRKYPLITSEILGEYPQIHNPLHNLVICDREKRSKVFSIKD